MKILEWITLIIYVVKIKADPYKKVLKTVKKWKKQSLINELDIAKRKEGWLTAIGERPER